MWYDLEYSLIYNIIDRKMFKTTNLKKEVKKYFKDKWIKRNIYNFTLI